MPPNQTPQPFSFAQHPLPISPNLLAGATTRPPKLHTRFRIHFPLQFQKARAIGCSRASQKRFESFASIHHVCRIVMAGCALVGISI